MSMALQEVPNELALAIEVTNCPFRCHNCHSSELQEDIGVPLTIYTLENILARYYVNQKYLISCILFMGGDQHPELLDLLKHCKTHGLKTALYTGHTDISDELKSYLDFYKVGQYIEECGDLTSPTTNQRFYIRDGDIFHEYKFYQT